MRFEYHAFAEGDCICPESNELVPQDQQDDTGFSYCGECDQNVRVYEDEE